MPGLGQEDSEFAFRTPEASGSDEPLTREPLLYVPSEEIVEKMRVQALVESAAAWEELRECDDIY